MTDPALGEYIPQAGKDNSQLPGMGGIFNLTNANLYHYAGNNPVKYTDPDGRSTWDDFICLTEAYYANLLVNAVPVCWKDFKGKTKNFFSNLLALNGNAKWTLNASFIGTSGEFMLLENSTEEKSFKDHLEIENFDINNFAGSITGLLEDSEGIFPVTVTNNSISISINCVSIEVSSEENGIVKGAIGLSLPLPPGCSLGTQVSFSTDVNDGKYGTLENEKNPDLNARATVASQNSANIKNAFINWAFGDSF